MMREKIWKDCPVCGAKGSMRQKSNVKEIFKLAEYPPVTLRGLSGQFCNTCGDGFWSLASEGRITQELGEHMAHHDAGRVVAAELASVQEAADIMHVTPQAVHKMMQQGRLRYVPAAGKRFPIRSAIPRVG